MRATFTPNRPGGTPPLKSGMAAKHSSTCFLRINVASQKLLWALTPLAAATLIAGERPAQAILNYYIYENSGNVIVETAGGLNLPSSTDSTGCGYNGALASSNAVICTGVDTEVNRYALQAPAGFGGSAFLVPASAVSGISTGLNGFAPHFAVDPLYVSKTPIVSSATFNGQTLAGLGFTEPGLVGTWTLVGTGDTINVCVGNPGSPCGAPPSAVPGPLPLLGAAAAFGYSRRLRRRVNIGQATPPQA